MIITLKHFWQNWTVRILLMIILLLVVSHFVWLYKKVGWSTEIIPLHYNIYFGSDWLGASYWVYLYPTIGLLIVIVNLVLAYFFVGWHRLISYFLLSQAIIFNILLIVSSFALFYYRV